MGEKTAYEPTIDDYRPMVLRVLSDGRSRARRDLYEAVADYMQLSDQVRAKLLPSGQERYMNRINWACSSLVFAGLVERPERGHYRITADGQTVDGRGLTHYSERDMLEWAAWRDYKDEVAARRAGRVGTRDDATVAVPIADPETEQQADPVEVMIEAQEAFNAQTESALRKRLQQASPEFFEKAVVDLLWAMGYGGAYGEKKRVGRSGDGGIDGIIRQDALGLTNIYIQAKRYADTNKVGDPEIRNFIGSLDAQGASLGVFLTTSSFQPKAVRTAAGYRHGKIVLIDGIELTRLMLAYGVAVHKTREFTLYEIDDDFFDEEFA